MNLGKQIDSLLKRQTSVYVRGLGVFRRVHTSATFDAKRKVFLPPISFVEFDHFSDEGYDFVSYWQQLEQIERSDAEQKLNVAVSFILSEINNTGESILDDLGSLVSYGNSYIFKPLDLSGFLYTAVEDEYYEFVKDIEVVAAVEQEVPTVEITDINLVEFEQEITSLEPKENTIQSVVESAAQEEVHADPKKQEVTSLEQEEASISEEELSVPKSDSNGYIYGFVAAFAILILGGIYYYATYYQETIPLDTPVAIVAPTVDSSLLMIDTTASQLVADTAVMIQDSIVEQEVIAVPKSIKEGVVTHKYIIIIGTHPTLESANAEAEAYNKKGFKSVRVLEPNLSKNLKRVIWDTYPTREQRDSALREVRKNNKADAWPSEIN